MLLMASLVRDIREPYCEDSSLSTLKKIPVTQVCGMKGKTCPPLDPLLSISYFVFLLKTRAVGFLNP